MLVGNKANLRYLRVVSAEDAKAFSETVRCFVRETSAVKYMNEGRAFSKMLSQMYRVVSNKALAGGENRSSVPEGLTDTSAYVSAMNKVGCCSVYLSLSCRFLAF